MRKFFTFLTIWLGFSLTVNAQIYTFTGDVDYNDSTTGLDDVFDYAATFTATLEFDTSQTIADAFSSDFSPGYFEDASYNYSSLTFQLGNESWSHNGTYANGAGSVFIQDGINTINDDIIQINGESDQILTSGTIVYFAYFFADTNAGLFSGTDASNLLAFNHDGSAYTIGHIHTDLGTISLSNITMTSGVPEPATWLMMIIGFGMVSAVSRKRRRAGASQGMAA